jgi:hypothetical protein
MRSWECPARGRGRIDPAPMDASTAVIAAYEAALPDDPRVERKRMFGMPCAFVNRQMFFGTFDGTVVARVGPERVEVLAGKDGMRVFTPSADRAWPDYVQLDADADPGLLRSLAAEALAWASKLPPKSRKPRSKRK